MNEAIEKYLKHIKETCHELSDDELLKFSKDLIITELNKNDLYINKGQIQKQSGFLVKGLIRAFHTDHLGNEKNIYFIPENEYAFHYASFISQEPCPLSFQCLEPSIVISFSINHLDNSYQTNPKFERYARLILEEKLKNQQQRLESLLYKNAEQRYIEFINQYPQLFNRITISELCSYLGVERQTITRIRKKISGS
ncbi:Crp/Fnr family transcriptional regulator [Flavobacterium johnsoniae]|uniref:Transcriptional regulator, RpiR family n=1 Tax=Flavobacterium johnsoniae TaxID=986 RepID=A0A1M5JBU7_FLAJO|nr:Crp/Fnr family transcriptional regulator [Flavobacterium johnsoniae]SHG37845.1 transcriptional regulator, RpiR family [Flavobacterium johnsoniae]